MPTSTTVWLPRELEAALGAHPVHPALKLFPVWLLLGPRQAGKTSLLKRLAGDREYRTLDELEFRMRAEREPELVARELPARLVLDEIQYAPALLAAVKQLADRKPGAGAIWLTGSQNFRVMQGVRESLAGRIAILHLHGLTASEEPRLGQAPEQWFQRMFRGSLPRLAGEKDHRAIASYWSNYTATYLERDVRELLGVEKRRAFELFVRSCALRTGQLVNLDELARDCRVSAPTARTWLDVLADSFQVLLLPAYHSNRLKRLAKSPKLHWLDTGLASWLAGWRTAEQVTLGPMSGALFESSVVADLWCTLQHRLCDASFSHLRTRDGKELDLVVEWEGRRYPVEIKKGLPDARELPSLEALGGPGFWQEGTVLSLAGSDRAEPLGKGWKLMHPRHFADYLLRKRG